MLVSDNGYDFTKIAEYFHCDYVHKNKGVYSAEKPPYVMETKEDVWEMLDRIKVCCEKYSEADWILFFEDDVFTRARIKCPPPASMGGPCTCDFTLALKDSILKKYPWLQINGYSGCGGTIFHRNSYLKCMENPIDLDEVQQLDDRVRWYSDALLTYLFLYNGFENKPWADHSESSRGRGRCDAAFDHRYKEHYNKPWNDSMIGQ
jgi:hypothetical protein